jgi:catalase
MFLKPIDMETNKKKLTTASGIPYAENENSMTLGPRGPILLQDFILHEKMAHFNREYTLRVRARMALLQLHTIFQNIHAQRFLIP